VIYTVWAFDRDPVLRQWTAQNQILSPHPLHYAAAYGLLIPFGILGAVLLLRNGRDANWLPIAWSLALPVLVYAPYPLQRRLAEGYWVALVVLALVFFDRAVNSTKFEEKKSNFSLSEGILSGRGKRSSKRIQLHIFQWLLGFTFPTTLFLIIGGTNAVKVPQIPIFRPRAEVEAFLFLDQLANADSDTDTDIVVLASFETGNALPAWAPLFMVIGHGPESVGLAELRPRVERVYQQAATGEERLELLRQFQVDFLFWGPHERQLGDWDPNTESYLHLVYDHQGYSIYAVNLSDN